MSDNNLQEGPPAGGPSGKPGWIRPVSYVLLGLGLALTFFYDRFADSLDIPRLVLQSAAIICLMIGAGLFFMVREKSQVDRAGAYREVFGKKKDDNDSQDKQD